MSLAAEPYASRQLFIALGGAMSYRLAGRRQSTLLA